MKKLFYGVLATLFLLSWSPALAADKVPLVIDTGKTRQMATGETVPIANGGTGSTTAGGAAAAILPTQSGHSGEYLTTNGTVASWAASGGAGTVTTTGSPASGAIAKFSGSTSITNGDLSGDCTTSASLAIVCTKTNGTSFGTLATQSAPTGSTQCLQANSSGVVSGTGSSCGSGASPAVILISEVVTSSSATNVSFTSISSAYRDLEVRVRGRATTASGVVNIRIRFNNDTGANYDFNVIALNNATPSYFPSAGQTSGYIGNLPGSTATANYAGSMVAHVGDYRGTTFFKSGISQEVSLFSGAAAGLSMDVVAFLWRNTSAINRVDIFPLTGAFVDNTVVSIYGRL